MFRRTQTAPAPSTPEPKAIAITMADLAALERALLEAHRLSGQWIGQSLPYYGPGLTTVHDVIAMLYQRAGAASVAHPDDPQRIRLPLFRHEVKWLADAITTMEQRWARASLVDDARQLYRRFNFQLGEARAVIHMGGTAAFDPESAQVLEGHVIPSREQ